MKKKNHFTAEPPNMSNIGEANALIRELWTKLREYEDRLAQNSRNSSRSPASDTPQARAERQKLNALVAEIRLALSQATKGTADH
ncbi:hypothetical protein CAG70_00830 [Photobacterium halotolerans]|uniref:IS66 family transposase n=1 Tax=Photobacterium halotolerans TaxID=265726 RepID=A0A7X4WED5_9GAMM|nr:hypothetical protein [Photobacterium halotolerans]NAW65962.1 IS66 family transposase [Photobacterium halotolerans]NAW88530.1 hypothetical protein [Photobacterium halotolerans]NAX45546.1 hypothetical protein [Photobacterium halotolerans]